ncbi:CHAP domain-containing protein [Winogradskyella sp. J14-2]|uniref:CHAP domain-containing protein n=1 Tax=Winogradskyella sp. J14-2 TaxID=1936080 RepID=UPI000972A12D|nr:CHAP domain-containing protein [Winogradskyella sp. J14-2]APY08846.1 CHAP domain-containing protein [Winogradskyella sp. J14-2]
MNKLKKQTLLLVFVVFAIGGYILIESTNPNPKYSIGEEIDNLNGTSVYYNGKIDNVNGRAISEDGYNLGLKFQCVEFVKRYYYEQLHHKMPESYGHAKDFFIDNLKDGQLNKQRGLIQYTNPSKSKPKVNDLLIYSGTFSNKHGHVSIISEVNEDEIEITQQNSGPYGNSRERYDLLFKNEKWQIDNSRILGWLRK